MAKRAVDLIAGFAGFSKVAKRFNFASVQGPPFQGIRNQTLLAESNVTSFDMNGRF